MFEIHGTTIRISRGDTGLVTIRNIGRRLTANDRVLMTIARKSGGVLYKGIAQPDSEGKVQFPLLNEQTIRWREGEYEWDVRIVSNAIVANGEIKDGQEVATPIRPSRFIVLDVVGRVELDGEEEPQPTDQSGITVDVQSFVGPRGADGKTPVKGTDYYTEADKTEMVNLVLAALPAAEGVGF